MRSSPVGSYSVALRRPLGTCWNFNREWLKTAKKSEELARQKFFGQQPLFKYIRRNWSWSSSRTISDFPTFWNIILPRSYHSPRLTIFQTTIIARTIYINNIQIWVHVDSSFKRSQTFQILKWPAVRTNPLQSVLKTTGSQPHFSWWIQLYLKLVI